MGEAALCRHPHQQASGAAIDARKRPAGADALRWATRTVHPRGHDRSGRARSAVGYGSDDDLTLEEGQASVMLAVDHYTAEIVGIQALKRATRWEGLEPIRQGVRKHFGAIGRNVASGLELRHDHGSQYMSDAFQQEIAFLGIQSSPRSCTRRQRVRRARHPHAQRTAAVDPLVLDDRGTASCAHRLGRAVQRTLDDRTASASVTGARKSSVLRRPHQIGGLRKSNYLQPRVQEILDRFMR